MKKKIKLLIFAMCLVLISSIILLNKSIKHRNIELNIKDYLYENQLPNGLFLEGETSSITKKDVYSTLQLHKIKSMLYEKSEIPDLEDVNICDISHIQALLDSNIILDNKKCEECKEYIENIEYYKSLTNNGYKQKDYIINLLFTIQALQVAKQYNLDISYKNEVKDIIILERNNLDSTSDDVTFYTVLQGIKLFEIDSDQNFITSEIKKRMDKCFQYDFTNFSDVISLYYITKLAEEYNVNNINISDDFSDLLMGVMSCTYDNVSIFYDIVYILYQSDKLDNTRKSVTIDLIKYLSNRFYISDGWYNEIIVQTPSLEGTYAAIMLAKKENITLYKLENIKSYLEKLVNSDLIFSLNKEEVVYIYKISKELNINFNEEYKILLHYYFENNSYDTTIPDLYYTFMLVNLIGDNNEYYDNILHTLEENLFNYDKLNNREISMLLLMEDSCGIDVQYDKKLMLKRIEKSNSILELEYLFKCYKQIYKDDSSFNKIVREKISKLENKDGYFLSLEIKKNTFYSLLIGLELNN